MNSMNEIDDATVVRDPRKRRLILIAMCVALVAVVASVSGLNVAQQNLALDLGVSQNMLLWIINGYTLVLAALLLPIGAIGDKWGRKPVLLFGLGIFAAANLVASMATSGGVMLLARLVAGLGAAMIMPVTLSVITSSFPKEERGSAVGVWAGFAGAGGILGLFFSSAMVDWFTWPWLFAMPIVLCVIAFALAMISVDNSREVHAQSFDVIGGILSAVAIAGLVLAIHEGPEHGWTANLTLLGIGAGSLCGVAFVAWELRQEHPLLDVRVFRNRSLSVGALNLMITFAVMFGLFLVLVQYLQAVLEYSALRSATSLLPMAALMMPLSNLAPKIVSKVGTRITLILGTSLLASGLVVMALLSSVDGGYLSVLPGLLLIGAGIGLAMTPSTIAITGSLPTEKQGVASALNDTVRELGGAIGVALLGSALSSGYRTNIAAVTGALPAPLKRAVEDGIGSALAVAPRLGGQTNTVLVAARQAFVDGWHTSMWIGAGLVGVALAVVVFRGPQDARAIADDIQSDDLLVAA